MTCPIKKTTSPKSFAQRCAELDPCYTEPEIIYDGATCTKMYAEWNGTGEWESLMWQIGKWVYNNDTMRNEFQLADIPCNTICNEEQVMFTGLEDDDYVILMTACVYDENGVCCCKSFDFCNCLVLCPSGQICINGKCEESPVEWRIEIGNEAFQNTGWSYQYSLNNGASWSLPQFVSQTVSVVIGQQVLVRRLAPPLMGNWNNFSNSGANTNSALLDNPSNASDISTPFTMPIGGATTTLNYFYVFTKLCIDGDNNIIFNNDPDSYCEADLDTLQSVDDIVYTTIADALKKYWKQINNKNLFDSGTQLINLSDVSPTSYDLQLCTPPVCEILNGLNNINCVDEPLCFIPKYGLAINSNIIDAGSVNDFPTGTVVSRFRMVSIGNPAEPLADQGKMLTSGNEFIPTKPFTYECWTYINEVSPQTNYCYALFAKQIDGNNNDNNLNKLLQIGIFTTDGGCGAFNGFGIVYANKADANNAVIYSFGANPLPLQKWVHIVIVKKDTSFDATAMDCYINGIKLLPPDKEGTTTIDVPTFDALMLNGKGYIGFGSSFNKMTIFNRTRIFQDNTFGNEANSILNITQVRDLFNNGDGVDTIPISIASKKLILDLCFDGYKLDGITGLPKYVGTDLTNKKGRILPQNSTVYEGRLRNGFNDTDIAWNTAQVYGRTIPTATNSVGSYLFSDNINEDFRTTSLPPTDPPETFPIITKYRDITLIPDESIHAPFGDRGRTTIVNRPVYRRTAANILDRYLINEDTYLALVAAGNGDEVNFEIADYVSRYESDNFIPGTFLQIGLSQSLILGTFEYSGLPLTDPNPLLAQEGYTLASTALTYIPAYLKI